MKSLAELAAIREKMQNKVNLREGSGEIRVVVGMATCGIAAGARPVLNAVVEGVNEAGLADKVCAFITPMMVGGKNATPAVGGEGFSRLADAARLTDIKTEMVGKDLCVSGYIVKE